MARLAGIVVIAVILLNGLGASVHADTTVGCRQDDAGPRAYLDCLNAQQKASERNLAHGVASVRQAIEAHQELQPAQRKRWLALFEESQGRFLQWRNFECQSIAPFEGKGAERTVGGRLGGVGVIEQRLVCLTGLNHTRARDLEARYAPPEGWPAAPAHADGPEDVTVDIPPAGGGMSPVMPTGAPRIIEMTP